MHVSSRLPAIVAVITAITAVAPTATIAITTTIAITASAIAVTAAIAIATAAIVVAARATGSPLSLEAFVQYTGRSSRGINGTEVGRPQVAQVVS